LDAIMPEKVSGTGVELRVVVQGSAHNQQIAI
jgi:hypothetical protein